MKKYIATKSTPITGTQLNAENCNTIYGQKNGAFISWQPGRKLNSLVKIEAGEEYHIELKDGANVDLSKNFKEL